MCTNREVTARKNTTLDNLQTTLENMMSLEENAVLLSTVKTVSVLSTGV